MTLPFPRKQPSNDTPRRPVKDNAMTNAERARRYRDRKRGAPAYKRALTLTAIAKMQGISRISVWRAKVIAEWAPELALLCEAGQMSLRRAFPVAARRRDRAVMRWVSGDENAQSAA